MLQVIVVKQDEHVVHRGVLFSFPLRLGAGDFVGYTCKAMCRGNEGRRIRKVNDGSYGDGGSWRAMRARWAERRQTPSFELLLLHGTLVVVAVVTTALTLLYPEHPLLSDFGPEIATNAVAILVTVAFVQRLLERQERRRRLRGSVAGLRRAARALTRLQDAWVLMLKGCLPNLPAGGCGSTRELFVGVRTEELMYLDPGSVHPTEGVPSVRWLVAEIEAAREALRTVARQYGDGFDVEYLEALEELCDDAFLDLVTELGQREVTPREWRVRINGGRGARIQYFAQLLQVLELHDRIATEAAALRGARTRPRTAELGIPLANDHDLRVATTLAAAWWNEAPRSGSFRQPRQSPEPAMPVGTDVARVRRAV
jgi:hypothetical protein